MEKLYELYKAGKISRHKFKSIKGQIIKKREIQKVGKADAGV